MGTVNQAFGLNIAEQLRISNRTLMTLNIYGGIGQMKSKSIVRAFVNALEANYELYWLSINEVFREQDVQHLRFLLRLNREGRGLILSGHHGKTVWVNKLIAVSDCLSSLFYYLSCNPTLCEVGSA